MANCLNCGKEVPQTEGKRKRQYCDNKGKCKNEYFRKLKENKQRRVILIEDENGLWQTADGRKCKLVWSDEDFKLPEEAKLYGTQIKEEDIDEKPVFNSKKESWAMFLVRKKEWEKINKK